MESIPLKDIADGLTDISWDILDILSRKQNLTYNELRKSLGLSADKSFKEVARLEGGRLIESKRDPKDQRVMLLNISDYGTKIKRFQK